MRVGRAFGKMPHVVAVEPFACVLWDYIGLREVQHVDELIEESERIRVATLAAMAQHKPSDISREDARLQARIRAYGRMETPAGAAQSRAELLDFAMRTDAALDLGGVFDDTRPVS